MRAPSDCVSVPTQQFQQAAKDADDAKEIHGENVKKKTVRSMKEKAAKARQAAAVKAA